MKCRVQIVMALEPHSGGVGIWFSQKLVVRAMEPVVSDGNLVGRADQKVSFHGRKK
tara:strand:+ start:201 stop:368 length:168 start_codon:yes stop_codon:yes gene_type:complete